MPSPLALVTPSNHPYSSRPEWHWYHSPVLQEWAFGEVVNDKPFTTIRIPVVKRTSFINNSYSYSNNNNTNNFSYDSNMIKSNTNKSNSNKLLSESEEELDINNSSYYYDAQTMGHSNHGMVPKYFNT